MKFFLILCFVLYSAAGLHAQAPRFRHYTVTDGVANSTVYYAMQDAKGYMWFCTESGVNRFDGRKFETFTIADGLADNENFKCYEDSRGRIWFMSYNGKLSYYQDSIFINEEKDPGLKYEVQQGKYIIDMEEDRQGRIWFATFQEGIRIYDGSHIVPFGPIKTTLPASNNYMLFTCRDAMQTLCFSDTIFRFDLTKGEKKYDGKNIYNDCILYVCKQYSGNDLLFFTTHMGLAVQRKDAVYTVLLNKSLGHKTGAFRIIHNDLWICTTKGLVVIRDFTIKGYTGVKTTFLKNIFIAGVTTDHEGGIWVTTISDGIYYIPADHADIENFQGNSFISVSHQPHSALWATGTYYGELKIRSNDTVIRSYRFPNGPVNRIKAIKWLTGNKLLIVTDDSPFLYDVTENKMVPVLKNQSYWDFGLSDMDEGEAGLWLSGKNAIFLLDKNLRPKRVFGDASESHLKPRIVCIAEGGAKGCWFTSIQKLYWLELATGEATTIAGIETFKSNLKDLKYVNGYLWIATDGNGLFVFKDGKLYKHLYSKNTNITSDICHKLVYDGKDNIWVATNKGVCVYNIHSYGHLLSFSSNNVLVNDDIKDIALHEGKAYIATPSEVSVIDIHKFTAVAPPPKIYIRYLTANGRTYNAAVDPVFYYANGVINISYTAITFQANQSLEYRYRIKGKGDDWHKTSMDRIEFYNLAPGTYVLLVAAKKYNSDWSRPAACTFTILPLWYQSWWFRAGIGVIACSVFYRWAVWMRKREAEKKQYHLKIAELKNSALASQMNPHFMFNAINSIQGFIFENDELAANEYLTKFARLMRLFLESSKQTFTSLKNEVELLRLYTDLEKLRFEEKINISIVIDERLNMNTEIPSVLIQPFVENAINHGLIHKEKEGHLLIRFIKTENGIMCIVDDDGIGRACSGLLKKRKHTARGIETVQQRMDAYSGLPDSSGFTFTIIDKTDEQGKCSGTCVEILFSI